MLDMLITFGAVAEVAKETQETGLGGVLKDTFWSGGVGAAMVQLMFIAVMGWLFAYIAEAANNGKLAAMIKVLATFAAIGLVAKEAGKAIYEVLKLAGLV